MQLVFLRRIPLVFFTLLTIHVYSQNNDFESLAKSSNNAFSEVFPNKWFGAEWFCNSRSVLVMYEGSELSKGKENYSYIFLPNMVFNDKPVLITYQFKQDQLSLGSIDYEIDPSTTSSLESFNTVLDAFYDRYDFYAERLGDAIEEHEFKTSPDWNNYGSEILSGNLDIVLLWEDEIGAIYLELSVEDTPDGKEVWMTETFIK